ncbi:MAG: hypothetical protein KDA87_21670, partial [Planctomycetales bacterium]|nr:hypothetical protein [Planctomycetales bacterium]
LKLQSDAKITNVFNDPKLKERLPGVAAVINGEQVTLASLAEECLERHGDLVLDSEINYRLLRQALKRNGKTVEQPELVEEVDRAAEMYGYINNGKPDRERWLKDVQEQEGLDVETYVREAVWPTVALKKLVAEQVKVTEEDLQKGFEANFGPAVEVLAIVLSNQRRAQEVWEQARNNPTKEFFGELASLHSIEPVSRANMGEVPPIRKHGGQPLIETEAYRLTEKDPLSGIISVADRFIIMYYTGRTQPVVTEMDAEVRKELYRELQEKKLRVAMAEEFDRLKETAQIDNFLKRTTQSGVRQAAARPASTSPQLVRPASQRTRRTVK